MALFRIDGWDYWVNAAGAANNTNVKNNAMADGYYGDLTQVTTNTGRFGTGLAQGVHGDQFSSALGEAIGKRWDNTYTCVIGQAVMVPTQFTGRTWNYAIVDAQGGSGTQFWVEYDDFGVISLYTAGGVLKARTLAKTWHVNEWDYVEIKFKIHATAGMIEVRVNTVVKISYVGNTTSNITPVLGMAPGWDSVTMDHTGSSGLVAYVDDRYILDNTGPNNNDYLGNVRVNTQLTSAPGDLTEMLVTGASANWDAVNEALLTEAEYVYSSTVGDRDLYTMNPNVTAQNVFGVQVTGAFRQDDSTQMKAHILVKTHGTLYEGTTDQYLAQTYHYYREMYELNPNTGVGWTAAELNAIQAGQKLLLG